MLTNKKIGVLIIMILLLFLTSCNSNIIKEKNNDKKIDKISIDEKILTGKKNKAFGGEVLEEGSKNISISDGIDNKAPQKPDFIK